MTPDSFGHGVLSKKSDVKMMSGKKMSLQIGDCQCGDRMILVLPPVLSSKF
jgi:hypothetical protein